MENNHIDKWITETRFRLPGWGTWLIGHEPNTQDPETFETAEYRILIFRLSPYGDVAMSMTHGLLGQLSRNIPGVYVDFGFMPSIHESTLMVRSGIPPLFGTTSRRPYHDFHLIAFSNSVSQEILNLPWLLNHSGIPLDFNRRTRDNTLPLLIMGGANAQSAFTACATQYGSGTAYVDALYLGEAEAEWLDILRFLIKETHRQKCKRTIIETASQQFSSFLAAQSGESVKKQIACLASLNHIESLVRGPVWYEEKTLGTASMLLDAGCPYLCAFCKEAWERRPYRTRSLNNIISDIHSAKRFQGLDTINLFSFNLTSHPDITEIISQAGCQVANVLMKSQRIDQLVKYPEILVHQQRVCKTNFTFGLEGISRRIRAFLGKTVRETHVLEGLKMIFSNPLRQIKLFLILTGHEEESDWREFKDLLEKIQDIRKDYPKTGKASLVLSVAPLIPMPHTPMQFHAFPDQECINEGMTCLRQTAHNYRMIFREGVSMDEARMAMLLLFADGPQTQAVTNAAMDIMSRNTGMRKRREALERRLSPQWVHWVYKEKTPEDRFPWDILHTHEDKKVLYKAYVQYRSRLEKDQPEIENKPIGHKNIKRPKPKAQERKPLHGIWFSVEVLPELAGLPVLFFQVALARSLMLTSPDLTSVYHRPGPSVPDIPDIPTSGKRIFRLDFQDDVTENLEQIISKLPPQPGWTLLEGPLQRENVLSDHALLEMTETPAWLDNQVGEFLNQLNASAVHHQIKKLDGIFMILISKPFVKKTGFEFAVWEVENNSFFLAVSDGTRTAGFLKKTHIPDQWKSHGRVFRLTHQLKKATDKVCDMCGTPIWVNALDDAISEPVLCRSLCHGWKMTR